MSPSERVKAWQTKHLFFLTPQVLMNDLSRGALPSDQVKCLVVDEAHKALGNHAYCQVGADILWGDYLCRRASRAALWIRTILGSPY
jgi:Fanconi anemia group M protein